MIYGNAYGLISELEISTRKVSEGHYTRLTLKSRDFWDVSDFKHSIQD